MLGNSTRVIYIPTCFRKWLCFPLIALSEARSAGNYCIKPRIHWILEYKPIRSTPTQKQAHIHKNNTEKHKHTTRRTRKNTHFYTKHTQNRLEISTCQILAPIHGVFFLLFRPKKYKEKFNFNLKYPNCSANCSSQKVPSVNPAQ